MSQQYELVYLPAKGKANVIRLMLADQAIPYKYTEISITDWPNFKAKYPFGQLPVLIVNGDTMVAQSQTIARYLAREHGLLGSTSLEHTQVEMWADQTVDVRNKLMTMLYVNYEAGLQPFLEQLPSFLAPFEARLASQPETARYLVLGRLTLADYAIFDVLFTLQVFRPDCLDGKPALKAFYTAFAAKPAIQAYMQSDAFKALKTTGSPYLK